MSGPNSRPGKTARDHAKGTWHRHLENQEKRREWNRQYAAVSKGGGQRVIAYPKIGF